MKKILVDDNWNEEEVESPEYTFIALLKQGSFDYGYVEAYDINDSLVKQAYDNLVNQFKDAGCEEDTEICLIQLPTSKRICDLCEKAKFNGNNQSISSIEALEELYNDAECEILEFWESNSLTESKRRKKSKKKLGGYITYTTGDPDLNIKHFNKMHGTLGFGWNGDADQYDMVVGDTLPSGPEASGEGGESSGGEGGMSESLDEASNLTPEEKMREFDAGRRRENVKACGDSKLQIYYDICKQYGYTNALDKIRDEMVNRGLLQSNFKLPAVIQGMRHDIMNTDPADVFYLIEAKSIDDITDSIGLDSKTGTTKIYTDLRYLVIMLMYSMKFRKDLTNEIKTFITEHYTVTSLQLKQYITYLLGDADFMKRFNSCVNYVKNELNKKKESLTEAKRYVKRYYVRPQNIFCSNKEDILLALLRVGDENCSVYSLKNLKDHDDVHLLKPSDIIYYYDDGVLYDKNHVKVMDYDLFVKHEEKRKKYSNVEKAPEADVNKEYDDRLTKDDLQDKEAVANFKAINEKYTKNSLKEALDDNEIVDLGINDTDFAKSQSLDLDCVGNDFTAQKQDNGYVIKAYLILNDGNSKENTSFCKVCPTYDDLIKEIQKIPFTISNLDFEDDLIEDAFDLEFEDRNVFGEALENEEQHICCICGEEFTGYGNNPEPVKHEGVACDSCNIKFIIPARLEQLNKKEENE